MSYRIAISDVEALCSAGGSAASNWAQAAQDMIERAQGIQGLDSFAGTGANAVRARLQASGVVTSLALLQVAQELGSRLLLYQDGWHQIDGDAGAVMDEGAMSELEGECRRSRNDLDESATQVAHVIAGVSDIAGVSVPSAAAALDAREAAAQRVANVRTRGGELEARQAGEAATLDALLDALEGYVAKCEGTAPGGFAAAEFTGSAELASLGSALAASMAATDGLANSVSAAGERERALANDRAAEQRKAEGAWQLAEGALLCAAGAVAVVGSGGAALPLVLGAGAVAFGLSQAGEGVDNVRLGMAGDGTTAAHNLIRDDLLGGNQTLYDVLKFGFGAGAGGAAALGAKGLASGGLAGARLAWGAQGATSFVVKSALWDVASAGTGYLSQRGLRALGWSEGSAAFAGTLVSLATGFAAGALIKAPDVASAAESLAGTADDITASAQSAGQAAAHLDELPPGVSLDAEGTMRLKAGEVSFTLNPDGSYDPQEFMRQLSGQETGLRKLTVQEFLDNRDAYLSRLAETGSGRPEAAGVAQRAAREKALGEKVESLIEGGMSPKEAKAAAKEWIKTQAALHDPDMIAGGRPDGITGMGDKSVNSALGSLWRHGRAQQLDDTVRKLAEGMTEAQRRQALLDVRLVPSEP